MFKHPLITNIYKHFIVFLQKRKQENKYQYLFHSQGFSWDFPMPFFLKFRELGKIRSGINIFVTPGLLFAVHDDIMLPFETFKSSESFECLMLWEETTSISFLKEMLYERILFSITFFFNCFAAYYRFLLALSSSPFFLLMIRLSWDIFLM